MLRMSRTASVCAFAFMGLLCNPFKEEVSASPKSEARRTIRHKAYQLARKDHHLKRDIHRDTRQEKHVHSRLHNLREYLHSARGKKKGIVRSTIRHQAWQLARKEHNLERDIRRDKRQDSHIKHNLSDLRKFLHGKKKSKK